MISSSYKGNDSLKFHGHSFEKFNLDHMNGLGANNIEEEIKKLEYAIKYVHIEQVISSLAYISKINPSNFNFTMVKHYHLFEQLLYLTEQPNETIQHFSLLALIPLLKDELIEYSLNFGIISRLIRLLNTKNKMIVLPSLQCLSQITAYNDYFHDKVIFNFTYFDDLQFCPYTNVSTSNDLESYEVNECYYNTKHQNYLLKKLIEQERYEEEEEYDELIEKKNDNEKNKDDFQYLSYTLPGILPEEVKIFNDNSMIEIQSLQSLTKYLVYVENGERFISIPMINLMSSLLKYSLHPAIISFCFNSLLNIIGISPEPILNKIIKSFSLLSRQKREYWHSIFQNSNPSSWLGPLFAIQSIEITESLMLFVSSVLRQNEHIKGLPFNLLIEKLQYFDDKFNIMYYTSISIDCIIQCDKSVITNLIDLNILPISLKILQTANFKVKARTASYLTRIAQNCLLKHKSLMIDLNFIKEFIDILNFADEILIQKIFLALNELFSSAEKLNKINLCIKQVEDSIDFIESFQHFHNKSIEKTAQLFISRFLENQKDEYDEYDDDSPLFNF